jgi:hypothetical protein
MIQGPFGLVEIKIVVSGLIMQQESPQFAMAFPLTNNQLTGGFGYSWLHIL